jgi:gliding motility-associated protein GldC
MILFPYCPRSCQKQEKIFNFLGLPLKGKHNLKLPILIQRMKKSTISFHIDLDEKNIPVNINWEATDAGNQPMDTKAIACSVWDDNQQNTLRIDLWTKEMRVDEMDRFFVDTLGGLSQTIQNATGDKFLSGELEKLCERFVEYLQTKKY